MEKFDRKKSRVSRKREREREREKEEREKERKNKRPRMAFFYSLYFDGEI